MSYQTETILSQFKDSWVPKTWLTPTITITETGWTVVVTAASMVELTNWWYSYDFTSYEKTKTYLIDTDWWVALSDADRYQNTTNILDSYDNKRDWKWSGWGWPAINTRQLAKDVRAEKTKDNNKKGTMWEKLIWINNNDVIDMINNISIPDNKKDLQDIKINQAELKSNQEIIWEIQSKTNETLGNTVEEITSQTNIVLDWMNTNKEEIKSNIKQEIQNNKVEISFDYARIEKSIEESVRSDFKVLWEIELLKQELKKDIKWNKQADIKEYILKSLENQQLVETQKENNELRKEFETSMITIEKWLGKLQEKEVDFAPVYKQIQDIKSNIDKWTDNINKWLIDNNNIKEITRQYKQSMKYIIHIAKNIWNISKSDLNEIKNSLSK